MGRQVNGLFRPLRPASEVQCDMPLRMSSYMIRVSSDTHLRPSEFLKQCSTVSSGHPSTTNHRNIGRKKKTKAENDWNQRVTSSKRSRAHLGFHVDSGIDLTRKSSQLVDAPREQANQIKGEQFKCEADHQSSSLYTSVALSKGEREACMYEH